MATLKQIQARLTRLRTQAESMIADRAQAVLDDIRAMMERHGLTTADIDKHGKKPRRAAKPHVTLPAPAGRHETMTKLAKKGKLPAKYRNPKTGETWSGWARPPAWIANVKDRSKFLIDAEAVESKAKPKAAAKKVAAKKTRTTTALAPVGKKKTVAPGAKKTTVAKPATKKATKSAAKPAAKPAAAPAVKAAVKRGAPRKRAEKATRSIAPSSEQEAARPETATQAPEPMPTQPNDGAST